MILIRYFAAYREQVGCPDEQLAQAGLLLSELKRLLAERHGGRAGFLQDPRCLVALNRELVQSGDPLVRSGDEVAFYPPVSGG